MLTSQQQVLHIPLANSSQCYSGLKGTDIALADFIGLKVNILYCFSDCHLLLDQLELSHFFAVREPVS